jgi:hypothetical protein
MVISLLIQLVAANSATKEFMLPASIVTLIAALFAAGVAIWNTIKITKTQHIVAALSSQAARDLKDKEFKNDYYKKIIERRLAAYDSLEQIANALSRRSIITVKTSVGECTHEVYSFFTFEEKYMEFHELTTGVVGKTLWYSADLKKEIKNLQNIIANIGIDFRVLIGQNIGDDKLRLAGVKNDDELKSVKKRVITLIRKEIIEIQNIETFFAGLEEPIDRD